MNSEFKKLLEASYTKGFEECARTGHKVGQLDAIFNSIVMAEFAELIVKECMACATWVGKMNTTAVEPVHTAQAINQRIKKHFGVEQ